MQIWRSVSIYPAIRQEIDADDQMNEAVEEHHLVHVLIAELKKLKPSDERFEAKFNVLGELVKHHIEEEEGEMLPQAEKSNIDWDDLESRVMKRKEELMAKNTSRVTKATLTVDFSLCPMRWVTTSSGHRG